jgi:L-asparaginase / beta-aspartyl-peptidase
LNSTDWRIVVHGGAGVTPGRDYREVEAHMFALVEEVGQQLDTGTSALDAVEFAVAALEESGLYVAGRGSAPNSVGVVELDASIMDGATKRAGAVCAAADLEYPVKVARAVMDHSPHILLAGEGAVAFARLHGFAQVPDPQSYYRIPPGVDKEEYSVTNPVTLAHGTVGAVALDSQGRLAAATSTGGLFGKLAGRVGDTPLPGIGTWADGDVAISCTGIGETFILAGGASDIVARMHYGQEPLAEACDGMLDTVALYGGDGGLIALDAAGEIVARFNSGGLKNAWAGKGLQTKSGIA